MHGKLLKTNTQHKLTAVSSCFGGLLGWLLADQCIVCHIRLATDLEAQTSAINETVVFNSNYVILISLATTVNRVR